MSSIPSSSSAACVPSSTVYVSFVYGRDDTPSSSSAACALSNVACAPIIHRRDYTGVSDLYDDVAGGVADFRINNSRMTKCGFDKISKNAKRNSKGYKPKKSYCIIKDDKK